MKGCGVYMIENPLGEIYVGASKNLQARKKSYKYQKDGFLIGLSIKKHGFDNHEFVLLESCDVKELRELERFYIRYFEFLGLKMLNYRGTNKTSKTSCREKKHRKPVNITITISGRDAFNLNKLARKTRCSLKKQIEKAIKEYAIKLI